MTARSANPGTAPSPFDGIVDDVARDRRELLRFYNSQHPTGDLATASQPARSKKPVRSATLGYNHQISVVSGVTFGTDRDPISGSI